MDGIALAVAARALALTRFPLLGLEIVYALWFGAHELAVLGTGGRYTSGELFEEAGSTPSSRLAIAMLVLSLMLASTAIVLDRRGQRRIAFWLHIGAMAALLEPLLDFSHGRSAYLALALLALIGAVFLLLWHLLRRVSYGAVAAAVLLVATPVSLATRSTNTRSDWRS